MKKSLLLSAAVLTALGVNAQTVGNPKSGVNDENGNPYYLVSYDLEKGEFKQELPEIDETFIFAVDFTGTGLEDEMKKLPSNPKAGILGRGGAFDIFNLFNLSEENETAIAKADGRLFPIDREKNIYGAVINLYQMMISRNACEAFGPDADWENFKVTEPGTQVAFGDNVFAFGWSATNPGAEWWDVIGKPVQDVLQFQTAPYTGTKKSREFTYGDMHSANVPASFEGLDATAWHVMVDSWGGYAENELFRAATAKFGNPFDAENPGSFIVSWDPENECFAEANPEIDETFIFAVDFTGTGLEDAMKAETLPAGILGRSAAFDISGQMNLSETEGAKAHMDGRMFPIDVDNNIYGMTSNLFQLIVGGPQCEAFGPKDATWDTFKVCDPGQVFKFGNNVFAFGWSEDNPGAEWWNAIGEPVTDTLNWFMAPYTGTKKGADFTYASVSGETSPFAGLSQGAWDGFKNMAGIALPQDFAKVSGVKGISADNNAQVVAVEYYNVAGARIEAPVENGVTIVRNIMSNGAAKAVKVIR